MSQDLVIVATSAAAIYGWLCAVVPPAVHAARTAITRRTPAAWNALALAAGGAILWTVIPLAALFIIMMLEPRAGLALARSTIWLAGAVSGAACWMCHAAATRHVPRLGSDFEVATALAIVALVDDDPTTLSRVERIYRESAAPEDTVLRFYGSGFYGSNRRTVEP